MAVELVCKSVRYGSLPLLTRLLAFRPKYLLSFFAEANPGLKIATTRCVGDTIPPLMVDPHLHSQSGDIWWKQDETTNLDAFGLKASSWGNEEIELAADLGRSTVLTDGWIDAERMMFAPWVGNEEFYLGANTLHSVMLILKRICPDQNLTERVPGHQP